MKGHTDEDCRRHYRFRGFNGESVVIKESHESLVFVGIERPESDHMVWTSLTRDKAAKIAAKLQHFAMHGTLPVPKKQEPPKIKINAGDTIAAPIPRKVYV